VVVSSNGGPWSLMPSPNLTTTLAPLYGIVCASPNDCVAVGNAGGGGLGGAPPSTLVERWDGTSWAVDRTLDPGAEGNGLRGVACTSAGECVAVGYQGNVNGVISPLIEASW
jgi:hypothetical protein